MLLNSKSIKKYIKDPDNLAEEAQVGVDLTLKSLAEISRAAIIPAKGKTIHAEQFDLLQPGPGGLWGLKAGKAYSATLDQGLEKLPTDLTAFIMQRSSLNRNGCVITGSVFDPGYGCENLGCTIYPTEDIFIEEHARIVQVIIHTNEPVMQLYDGQYNKE